MLKIYALEFVSICGFICEKQPEQVRKNYIYLQPPKLRKMMDKNKFDDAGAKLHIWRNLGWLICDSERFTKSITVDKRRKRVSMLNLSAYRQLRELLEKNEGR